MLQYIAMFRVSLGFTDSNSNIAQQGMLVIFHEFPGLGWKLSDHRVVGLHRSEALQVALGKKQILWSFNPSRFRE